MSVFGREISVVAQCSRECRQPTPDVQPKFLETCTAKAVDAKDDGGSSGERRRSDQSVRSSMAADVQSWGTNS